MPLNGEHLGTELMILQEKGAHCMSWHGRVSFPLDRTFHENSCLVLSLHLNSRKCPRMYTYFTVKTDFLVHTYMVLLPKDSIKFRGILA